jgi:choline dehydrogenase-like flavoprotein
MSQLRQGYQALKRLTHGYFYTSINGDGRNPNWGALQYPGPISAPENSPPPIKPLQIKKPTSLDCDVVIVGSGAGGGVVAAELAQAGLKVIVLEKGAYYTEDQYSTLEKDALEKMYEQRGLMTTEDLGVTVLAGATLGGGTAINWSASFRTPDHVLQEWADEFQLPDMPGNDIQRSLDTVCERLGVNTSGTVLNLQNELLSKGAEKLGFQHGIIPRNVQDCNGEDCGWCGFGCIHGAKKSTLKTYLQDANDAGADIIVNCYAEKILVKNRHAVGVTGWVTSEDGIQHPLTVRAKKVISAAGAIHTPALLLRSGLSNPNIGRNLRLHPATATRAEYEFPIQMWSGVILSAYSDEFANLDGQHYGAILETPPGHVGLWAVALPWESGEQHKAKMLCTRQQAATIVIVRDRGSGQVTTDKNGQPRLHYQLSETDAKHMLSGVEGALRIHKAAGAHELAISHTENYEFKIGSSTDDEFETFLEGLSRLNTSPNRLGVYSAHQMGSCRMGGSRSFSAIDPTGKSWEVENLYVADASVFPTAIGVNPMITIMALAHHIAQNVKANA